MSFDLAAAARQEMIQQGFTPDFLPGTDQQLADIQAHPPAISGEVRDLRGLLWSSIDNDTSRDLDQIEVAERVANGIKIMVGVADVDSDVAIGSPIDKHAADQTTTVYVSVKVFSMLPEKLSTDLTSLNENADRLAVVMEMVVSAEGVVTSSNIYRAQVRNKAQLTYNGVGPWLEGKTGPPPKLAESADLQAQLKLQDEAAQALCDNRHRNGALDFDRVEAEPIIADGQVSDIRTRQRNRASRLIEDFMIAANQAMAQALSHVGRSSIRRIVKTPERWPRIVELAAEYGEKLPATPDSGALNVFLSRMRTRDEDHYPDISLAIIKLMGPGEYVLSRAGDEDPGHFALAAHDYTHSTAPNRRFSDLVTQRLIKAVMAKQPTPYTDSQLDGAARNCTFKEDAARKVERKMGKRVAAAALQKRIGQTFDAVVTGNTAKGVFVRVLGPPTEGMLLRGGQGVDVGDRMRVKLVGADPMRGFIDFVRA